MKKNRMMRLASILLVCVLLTTSVISGTFAKYTTSDSGTDTARVAKWGFEANDNSIVLDELFVNVYDSTVNGYADVVAPGTSKSVPFSFAYDTASNGVTRPEVDYTFTVKAEKGTYSSYSQLDANPNFYWTLKGPGATEATKYNTVDALVEAINALDGQAGAEGKTWDAQTLPTDFYGATPNGAATWEIGWEWLFQNTTGTDDEKLAQDVLDTQMGNADALDSVYITITITATQVD